MHQTMKLLAVLLAFNLAPTAAQADLLWDVRAGAKGAFAGNVYLEPSDVPPNSAYPWDNTQAYIGGGGGLFVECTLLTFLGLEIDLLFEQNAFMEHMSLNDGQVEYEIHTNMSQIRVPVLLKGRLPLGLLSLTLGVGPEFVFGRDADVSLEGWSSRYGSVSTAAKQQNESIYKAKAADGTFGVVDLGVEFSLWKIVIPLSLRVGYNLSQPASYDKRVTLENLGSLNNTAELETIESLHLSLMAGVGYVF